MYVFSWLDNRTLVACDFMLALAFAIAFFGMKRTYPNLRGIHTIAISFLLVVAGTFLIAARGAVPWFASVTLGNGCLFASSVFLHRGILRFIGSRKKSWLPIAVSAIGLGVVCYYSQARNNVVPRIVAIVLAAAIVRGLIAVEIFRKSANSTSPTAMRLFAASMSLFAAATVNLGFLTILSGATTNTGLQSNGIGTATLLLSVVCIFTTGLFILLLSSSELISVSRDESLRDSLSGAYNRRGIELKLAAELKRVQHGKHKLSIALIDVDYFKSINDIQGHAAGDAALRDVAETISTHLRGRDFLGRYGGDEFLLILPQTACSIALGVTERLSLAVSNIAVLSGSMPLTLSIGLTEAAAEDDAVTLIARADKALYQAKSDGRNCRRIVTSDCEQPTPSLATHPGILAAPVESSLLN
jgi:diguanylate cyclase (GGDEF)-like protein